MYTLSRVIHPLVFSVVCNTDGRSLARDHRAFGQRAIVAGTICVGTGEVVCNCSAIEPRVKAGRADACGAGPICVHPGTAQPVVVSCLHPTGMVAQPVLLQIRGHVVAVALLNERTGSRVVTHSIGFRYISCTIAPCTTERSNSNNTSQTTAAAVSGVTTNIYAKLYHDLISLMIAV